MAINTGSEFRGQRYPACAHQKRRKRRPGPHSDGKKYFSVRPQPDSSVWKCRGDRNIQFFVKSQIFLRHYAGIADEKDVNWRK